SGWLIVLATFLFMAIVDGDRPRDPYNRQRAPQWGPNGHRPIGRGRGRFAQGHGFDYDLDYGLGFRQRPHGGPRRWYRYRPRANVNTNNVVTNQQVSKLEDIGGNAVLGQGNADNLFPVPADDYLDDYTQVSSSGAKLNAQSKAQSTLIL
ncbi:unnamed protein product, partial [Meganyctiphanes norvegica]